MYLNNYQHLKNKETYLLIFLFSFSFLIRIPIIHMYGDIRIENEWGYLLKNLLEHGQLIYESFDGFLLPNLWMPPLYAYYIYFFSFFTTEEIVITKLVLYSQALLASLSVLIFYKLNKIFFHKKISFYSSLLLSFFPLYVFACSQISSISLQVFLIIFFIYFFFECVKKKNYTSIIYFSFTGGLLILLRGESAAIILLSLIYLFFFFKLSTKKILLIFLVTSITISPYLVRNFLIFEKVTIIKSFGYNLWRGNHPDAIKNSLIEGSEVRYGNLQEQVDGIKKDKFYRINYDELFLHEAITNFKKDPKGTIFLFLKKTISFLFINIKSAEPNYFNPLNYIPLLIIGITSVFGIVLTNKKSYSLNYLILILFAYVMIFSSVAILPRYKLVILPLQIIFTNVLLSKFKIWKNP